MDNQLKAGLESIIGKDDGDMNDLAVLLEGLLPALSRIQWIFAFHRNQTTMDAMITDTAHEKRGKDLEILLDDMRAAQIEVLDAFDRIEAWKVMLLETLDMRQRHCSMCKKLYVRRIRAHLAISRRRGEGVYPTSWFRVAFEDLRCAQSGKGLIQMSP